MWLLTQCMTTVFVLVSSEFNSQHLIYLRSLFQKVANKLIFFFSKLACLVTRRDKIGRKMEKS